MDSGLVASGRQLPTEGASRWAIAHRGMTKLQPNRALIVARMERSEIRGHAPQSRFPDALRSILLQPLSPLSSDLPVGRFVDRAVEAFFGFSEKYFCSHLPQITFTTPAIPSPLRGRFAIVTTLAWDAVDAAAFSRDGIAGGWRKPVSGHQARRRRDVERTATRWSDAPTLAVKFAEF